MCLCVHLGCDHPLQEPATLPGPLGIKPADWRPPPLERFPHIYVLGAKTPSGELGCSCLLTSDVAWQDDGPVVLTDPPVSENEPCPFEALRAYVAMAQKAGGRVTLTCDDAWGEDGWSTDDYDHLVVRPEMIRRESYLFVDAVAWFPWRAFYVTGPER